MDKKPPNTSLKRSLSLTLMIFYGLGTILGAGFYALIGKVAKHSEMYTPLAILVAAIIACFTAISYAELSSRYPVSAGEAYFIEKAFHQKWLSKLIGWLTILTGLVSAAAIAHGFAGYFQIFIKMPEWYIITGLILILGAIAAWGITESVIVAMVITLVEIFGLLLVVYVARDHLTKLPIFYKQMLPSLNWVEWSGIFSGAFIAFYAYVGFEDMINVAEEVKNVKKTLPHAIFIAMASASLLYLLVAVTVVLALPIEDLAQSKAPLALVIEHQGYSPNIISLISLIAMVNGALIQIIMGSRILYGLANQKCAPSFFGRVNVKTQTPLLATLTIVIVTIIFAICFRIETLAKITSGILLCIFTFINLSLIIIKKTTKPQAGCACYSILFPIVGLVISILFLAIQLLGL